MAPDEIWVLRVEEEAKTLCIISEKLYQATSSKAPTDCKRRSTTPFLKKGSEEDPGDFRRVSPPLVPGKIMEQFLLETILRHMEIICDGFIMRK